MINLLFFVFGIFIGLVIENKFYFGAKLYYKLFGSKYIEKEYHKTIPVKVWVDVDEGIADMVKYLTEIDGVRTTSSCQGTIGEGGPHPYEPYVGCEWTDKGFERLREEFDVEIIGDNWGYVHPKKV